MLRPSAVAGTWYSADSPSLARQVDDYLASAPRRFPDNFHPRAILAPHAGLLYSGAVAAAAYRAVQYHDYETIILVGPAHYVAFEGVAVWPEGAFWTPFGNLAVHAADARALVECSTAISPFVEAHRPEHSLEMQLPFVARLFPDTPIVALLMGEQTRQTVDHLAQALVHVYRNRDVLLVGSSDLSHFFDATTAERLDAGVEALVNDFDAEGLMEELERYPPAERGRYVMCGGGPAVAMMQAARGLGATDARVLSRSHSGVVSGDTASVVGYLAAAFTMPVAATHA